MRRIGQTKVVQIWELLMRGTVESHIENILKQKKGIFGAIVDPDSSDWKKRLIAAVANEMEDDEDQIILLDRVNQRMQFPELKAKSIEQYKLWEPDAFIVEKKSSGSALYQELRHMALPVQEYTPVRGSGDKVARLNAVADIVRSGKVWVPDTWWARELVEQVAQFPNGEHDDDCDTLSMALMRFRQGGYLTLQTDNALEDKKPFYARRAAYY